MCCARTIGAAVSSVKTVKSAPTGPAGRLRLEGIMRTRNFGGTGTNTAAVDVVLPRTALPFFHCD